MTPEGYRIRWATAEDTEALATLADLGHGADELDGRAPWLADGIRAACRPDHPSDVQFVIAEHVATGTPASMASVIPQTWTVGGHPVSVGRLESFATHPDHRRRGLAGAIIAELHEHCDNLGCHLTAISGLSWFYRQFGYDYALEHEGGWGIAWPDATATVTLRALTEADIDTCVTRERAAAERSHVWCSRSIDHWKAAVGGALVSGADGAEVTLVIERNSATLGHCSIRDRALGGELAALVVTELELDDPSWFGPGLIAALRPLAPADSLGVYLRLGTTHALYEQWPDGCDLAIRPSAWYIRVPDWSAFFRAAPPDVGDHAGDLWLSEYVRGTRLTFEAGQLVHVVSWSPLDDRAPHEAAFPPGVLAKLVLGYRSLDQLLDAYPDVEVDDAAATLLRQAFPPRPSRVRPLQ